MIQIYLISVVLWYALVVYELYIWYRCETSWIDDSPPFIFWGIVGAIPIVNTIFLGISMWHMTPMVVDTIHKYIRKFLKTNKK